MTSRFEGTGSNEQKMAAVLESIAFLIAVNIEVGDHVVGKCQQVLVTGGLASIDPLLQRIADLTMTTVVRAEMAEATARGLAYLLAEMPSAWPSVNVTQTFEAKENVSLMDRFHRWRALMPAANA
jgi:glycerol kinase